MSESIVKPIKEKIINQKTFVTAANLNQKNTCYIKKEKN